MMRAWVEISALEHGHGGTGWELGACLWSPARARGNSDRYRIMKKPAPGDVVFHLIKDGVNRRLVGRSEIQLSAKIVPSSPPEPGGWRDAGEYYRIELSNFMRFRDGALLGEIEAKHLEEIRSDIYPYRPLYHPYSTYGAGIRITQGLYLGLLTNKMLEIFSLYSENSSGISSDPQQYIEGNQVRKERTFFARNPALRREAIEKWGSTCSACRMNFENVYGEIGRGYIEVHHLEPLSTRSKESLTTEWTVSVEDVRPLCANCHRVAHRRVPPLSIAELKELISRIKK